MKFTKMQGCGNDYVYINCFEENVSNAKALAIQVSHRRFGVGSDGLILIKPTDQADAEMEMYNSDGSMSEMCGNGLRCVAKFVYDHGIVAKKEMNLLTGDGIKGVIVHPKKQDITKADALTIDMGLPKLEGSSIPSTFIGDKIVEQEISAGGKKFKATLINMGNPHCVIFVDNAAEFPVEEYGPILENHEAFPARINIEFVEVVSPNEVIQRTWERGSGETWACGTGASAVSVAGVLTGRTQSDVLIHLTGGDLQLQYTEGGPVIMTGPAVEVFTGQVN
tara:strand:+ start:124 stop:960 length:837 start_codon:yes stop_codon:yes gene_type:complete